MTLVFWSSTGEAIEVCDPSVDPWNCECDQALIDEMGFCEIVNINVLPDFSDPTYVDTSAWIETTWNNDFEMWDVNVDLASAPGKGIFLPSSQNGEWDTRDELLTYVSTLLGVPRDGDTGELEPFRYFQSGKALVLDPTTSTIVRSGGEFWKHLVSDNQGQVLLNDNSPPYFAEADDCVPVEDDVTEVGNTMSARVIADVCVAELSNICWSPEIPDCEFPRTISRAGSVSFVKSAAGFAYEIEEVETSSVFECENNVCRFVGNVESLADQPGHFRFSLVTADFHTLHKLGLDGEAVTQPETSMVRTNTTMSLVREGTRVEFGTSNPAYNSICADVVVIRQGDDLHLHAEAETMNALGAPPCNM